MLGWDAESAVAALRQSWYPCASNRRIGLLREAMQMTWTLIEMVAQEERVMAWMRCEGRHVGTFFEIPPTGHEFSFEALSFRYAVARMCVSDRPNAQSPTSIGS
jgi:SnoaL-like polyketide cyclase